MSNVDCILSLIIQVGIVVLGRGAYNSPNKVNQLIFWLSSWTFIFSKVIILLIIFNSIIIVLVFILLPIVIVMSWSDILSGVLFSFVLSILLVIIIVSVSQKLTPCFLDNGQLSEVWIHFGLLLYLPTLFPLHISLDQFLYLCPQQPLWFPRGGVFSGCFHCWFFFTLISYFVYRCRGVFHWMILHVTPYLIQFFFVNLHIIVIKTILPCLGHVQHKLSSWLQV